MNRQYLFLLTNSQTHQMFPFIKRRRKIIKHDNGIWREVTLCITYWRRFIYRKEFCCL